MSSTMSWGTFGYEVCVLLAAALAVAAMTWILTFWRWKPHLFIEQSASWRWMDDGKLCITVTIRYRNTSNYRAIRVEDMVAELQRLAPLSPDDIDVLARSNYGRHGLRRIGDLRRFRWGKENSRLVQPGEAESEVFIFLLSKEEVTDLAAFVAYTYIFPRMQPEALNLTKRNQRGWATSTCHDIIDRRKGGAMMDEPASKPDEKVTGTESQPYAPGQTQAKPAADDGGQSKDGASPSPPSPKDEG